MSRRPDVYFSISKKNPLPDHVTADQAEQLVAFERSRRDRLLLGGVGGGCGLITSPRPRDRVWSDLTS